MTLRVRTPLADLETLLVDARYATRIASQLVSESIEGANHDRSGSPGRALIDVDDEACALATWSVHKAEDACERLFQAYLGEAPKPTV